MGCRKPRVFYFLHSYYFQCKDAGNEVAVSEYGMPFTCAVNAGNIYGVQFHPEKSHANGGSGVEEFCGDRAKWLGVIGGKKIIARE